MRRLFFSADKSTSGISALTGGRTDFAVYRNGVLSSVSALRRMMLLPMTPRRTRFMPAIRAWQCIMRLAILAQRRAASRCWNGTQFTVLPTAQESLEKFKPGKTMTLLLTSDGSVAGAVDSENSARANAVESYGFQRQAPNVLRQQHHRDRQDLF